MNSKQFFYNFGKAMYHVDSFYDDFAKQSSISTTLLWVLYVLNDGNAHTQIEICKDWELPRTTVNTVVKEIEKNEDVIKEETIKEENAADEYDEISELTGDMKNDSIDAYIVNDDLKDEKNIVEENNKKIDANCISSLFLRFASDKCSIGG